ncbi:acyl-CoA dehydrogenase family protein [Nonomuraea ferruginea]|uniref:acyl-CoA dehydrogenase family protein n=1 Tax=Nonomuraea ferruginea TaxID=46174 RepID=UPI00360BAA8A
MNPADYQRAARDWLERNVPSEGRADGDPIAQAKDFMARFYDAGYSGITWPERWGGQGLTQEEERAFAAAARDFTLPIYVFSIGLGMTGPTLVDRDRRPARAVRPAAAARRGDLVPALLRARGRQ